MNDFVDVAAGLYNSLAIGDKPGILSRLHPEFVGHTTAGFPLGLGGDYHSPEAMLREFWGAIARSWAAAAHPTEYAPLNSDRLLVRGTYRGRGREAGTEFDAAFTHILRFREGRIVELDQLTDSVRWAAALQHASTQEETP